MGSIRQEAAIEGIGHAPDDFEARHFRPFEAFAEEQRRKYDL